MDNTLAKILNYKEATNRQLVELVHEADRYKNRDFTDRIEGLQRLEEVLQNLANNEKEQQEERHRLLADTRLYRHVNKE